MLYIKCTKDGSKYSVEVIEFANKNDLMMHINYFVLKNGERVTSKMNIDEMLYAINSNGYYHERITAKEAKELTTPAFVAM